MDNSLELIIGDIKKLFKELENQYGKVKPFICEVEGVEDCPNTKCWVQNIRDEYLDRINDFERIILNTISTLEEINSHKDTTDDLRATINEAIKELDHSINPTPCEQCSKNNSCKSSYKLYKIHSDTCPEFSKYIEDNDKNINIAVHF